MTPDALKLWYTYPAGHPHLVSDLDQRNFLRWLSDAPDLDDLARQIRTQEDAARARRKPEQPCTR
jgi:hypothetical protein